MTSIASPLLPQTVVSEQSTTSSLQVHGLTKRFHGTTTPVFKNVCFNIYKGQSVRAQESPQSSRLRVSEALSGAPPIGIN